MYGLACQPSKSYSHNFGYHCVMDKATPSSEILPERRICSGTWPSKSNESVVFCFGKIGFTRVTSKIVPTTLVVAKIPSCLKLAMVKEPISFGLKVRILLSF